MSAQQQLEARYGLPTTNYLHVHCTIWQVRKDFPWYPAQSFLVNLDFQKVLFKAYKALEAKNLHHEIKSFDGCYNDRSVRGASVLSLHAWAAAIDHNAASEGMQSIPASEITPEKRLGGWSQAFVDTMKEAGLFYGGDFHSIHADGTERIDPMHFALLDG